MQGAAFEGSDTRASASRGLFSFRLWTEFQRVESRFTGSLCTPSCTPVRPIVGQTRTRRKGGETPRTSACPPYLFRLAAAEQPSSHPRREGKRRDGAASAASSGCEGRGGVLTCVSGKCQHVAGGGSGSSSTITSHIKAQGAPRASRRTGSGSKTPGGARDFDETPAETGPVVSLQGSH